MNCVICGQPIEKGRRRAAFPSKRSTIRNAQRSVGDAPIAVRVAPGARRPSKSAILQRGRSCLRQLVLFSKDGEIRLIVSEDLMVLWASGFERRRTIRGGQNEHFRCHRSGMTGSSKWP
jgi:hypothetical protein